MRPSLRRRGEAGGAPLRMLRVSLLLVFLSSHKSHRSAMFYLPQACAKEGLNSVVVINLGTIRKVKFHLETLMLQVLAYVAITTITTYHHCFAFLVLGMEARDVFVLSKHSTA